MSLYEKKVYASIVYYNSLSIHGADVLEKSLRSLLEQNGFVLGRNLVIRLCDNASEDDTFEFLKESINSKDIFLDRNNQNIGFCGAHNQSVYKFLNSNCEFFFLLNPDLFLYPNALRLLVKSLSEKLEAGMACSKLYRGDDNLELCDPIRLDSAGMILTSSIRHFDRGSDEIDHGQYTENEYVFGGTGACLLLKKQAIKDLLLPNTRYDSCLYRIYPQLELETDLRAQLFDEAFFAYREDADLAWRAKTKGWKCLYVAKSKGIHRRIVLPTNRKDMSARLNYLSVRNRFLLQINNYSFLDFPSAFVPGIIIRNFIVLIAIFLVERTSLKALYDLFCLKRRQFDIRKIARKKA